jgi:hypothetical protein
MEQFSPLPPKAAGVIIALQDMIEALDCVKNKKLHNFSEDFSLGSIPVHRRITDFSTYARRSERNRS